jgi:hypothetical protein
MRAFHVYSLKPAATWYGRAQEHHTCSFPDFELLALILSALSWRRHNGSIKLYTDEVCAAYFAARGLDALWDDGIDTWTLEAIPLTTNFSIFWAFARTIALYHERSPCCMLDMDMIVWKPIAPLLRSDFMAIHSEPLDFEVYVPKEQLSIPSDYVWEDWDWTVLPCNAALMYFGRDDLRHACAVQGLKFMHKNFVTQELNSLPAHAVFVEQRLYPMCIQKQGGDIGYFLQSYQGALLMDGTNNDTFTHLWLYKRLLVNNHERRQHLCRRMITRIRTEFPAFAGGLSQIPEIRAYLPG